jgi:hypothetical protein
MNHPAVSLYHPYNETEGEQLKTAWLALDHLLPQYPELVLEERDVIHVHKYWWSLFENTGIYYDSASQFSKAIMVDEFGGNYLDGEYELGGYKTLKESYMRFLGKKHTPELRKYHHTISNARIAEYWRRIGAAGFSPFCAIGSWDDGNHWFEGTLKEGKPKPVWDALTAAYSPVSVSIDIWDRNFVPGQEIKVPLYLFNESDESVGMKIKFGVSSKKNPEYQMNILQYDINAFSTDVHYINIAVPEEPGRYTIKAELLDNPANIYARTLSSWDIRVFEPKLPNEHKDIKIGLPHFENELFAFCNDVGLEAEEIDTDAMDVDVIITSHKTWQMFINDSSSYWNELLSKAIDNTINVLMLDVGARNLGQGYPENEQELGPLQGVANVKDAQSKTISLFKGMSVTSIEAPEPESHIHPADDKKILWQFMEYDFNWLWNGYRGGLIVPAAEMELSGLSEESFLNYWKQKGADISKIKQGDYFAYELQQFYEFSTIPDNKNIINSLRKRVKFLADDAPALANSLNQHAPVKQINLYNEYMKSVGGTAKDLIPLVIAGKNLTRVPVVSVSFGDKKGKLIVSQLLTSGRLAEGMGAKGHYGVRYDPAAVQVVINMIDYITD